MLAFFCVKYPAYIPQGFFPPPNFLSCRMRQEQGLDILTYHQKRNTSAKKLSQLLLTDLKSCYCEIFGKTDGDLPILLAKLDLIPDSLYYEMFDQRIDFTVTGIISNQSVPLTYKVHGEKYSFHGRCSTILKVCGVDLYLSKSYTEKLGDNARQPFSISVKKLLKIISKQV